MLNNQSFSACLLGRAGCPNHSRKEINFNSFNTQKLKLRLLFLFPSRIFNSSHLIRRKRETFSLTFQKNDSTLEFIQRNNSKNVYNISVHWDLSFTLFEKGSQESEQIISFRDLNFYWREKILLWLIKFIRTLTFHFTLHWKYFIF